LDIKWVEKGPSCKVIIEPIGECNEDEGLSGNTE